MKYIMVTHQDQAYAFLFDRNVVHMDAYDMAENLYLVDALDYIFDELITCVGAGFVNEQLQCHGRSETLSVDARSDEDTQILTDLFNNEANPMKYIVIEHEGKELAFIFMNAITHKDMLENVRTMRVSKGHRGDWERCYRQAPCISAGFIQANGTCYGASESIGVSSRGDADTALVKKAYQQV